MLAGGTDPFYRRILRSGHSLYARVEVWSHDGQRLDTLLPALKQNTWLGQDSASGLVFLDGSLSATLTNRVSRTLSLTLPSYMYPRLNTDLLAPFGNEIRAYYGVQLGDGSLKYVWQVFRGMIRDVSVSSDGTCNVECADRAAEVQDVNFVSPQNSVPTNTINEEWQRLILDAIPGATFGACDTFVKTVEPLTWEFERSSALDEMASSVGALWYPLANGDFVLRRYPWTVRRPSVVEWVDHEDGNVNGWSARRSRDAIYNTVTVTGERLNGDDPVFATASDLDPTSPTYVFGNFGVKSLVARLQNPSTQGGAQGAAEAYLKTYVSPVEEWNLQVAPDASLELGDTGTILINDHTDTQVVTGFTLPIGLSGDMTISTRSLVIGGTPDA
jgi:hypothetical protein